MSKARALKPSVEIPAPVMRFHNPFRVKHGIECMEYKVMVRPVEAQKVTKGGIILADETHERDQHATMEGEVVEISPLAFSYEENAPKPKLGDTVVFQRYAGLTIRGADGIDYRLMNDKDIVAMRRTA